MYSNDFEKFKPTDLLKLSIELYNKSNYIPVESSAVKRTIVNRIYYASFLYLRTWFIENKDYISKGPLDHSKIPHMIIGSTPMMIPFEKDLRDKFLILGKNRRICDYELKIPYFNSKDKKYYSHSLEKLIGYSEEIIRTFEKF